MDKLSKQHIEQVLEKELTNEEYKYLLADALIKLFEEQNIE